MLNRGEYNLSLDFDYSYSKHYFSSSGSRRTLFSDGSEEHYHDLRTVLSGTYGFTPELTLWIDLPIIHRKETRTLNAEETGLGDVRAGTLYRFWANDAQSFSLTADLAGKFPSGETNIGFVDTATGRRAQLPLGSGNGDLYFGIRVNQDFGSRWSLEFTPGYTVRFDALAEFLVSTPIIFETSDGTLYSLPIGNLKIDWGDEMTAQSSLFWSASAKLFLSLHLNYLYRLSTHIAGFTLSSVGDALVSERSNLVFSAAQLLTARPAILWKATEKLRLEASVGIPVWGKNYPTVPMVESMVGNRYQLGIQYGF